MTDPLSRRLAALSGLALTAAVALWWLGSTRLALDDGSDASRPAADTLITLWLVRGMALALLAVRAGALRGWRAGAVAALGLIAPCWPLVVLAWSASAAPLAQVALAEAMLLAAGVALPLLGGGLRRALRRVELAEILGTAVGAALAATLWFTRSLWTLPVS
ncbi:MAG: hypothetical protein Q7U73_14115 [Rubrivivax sp.]|nr:hypothetical protein [Rubrivivax sp.]